jgi:hypothetical protein
MSTTKEGISYEIGEENYSVAIGWIKRTILEALALQVEKEKKSLGDGPESQGESANEDEGRNANRGCPCLYTTPCRPDCTCVKPFMSSGGCSRCCSYGSVEQRTKAAERLAPLIDNAQNVVTDGPSQPVVPNISVKQEIVSELAKESAWGLRLVRVSTVQST